MKKSLLTLAALASISTFSADAAWVKLTEASQLKAGVNYILVCESQNSVMSATPSVTADIPTHRAPISVTIENNKIAALPDGVATIQVEGMGSGTYALHQVNPGNSGYLLPVSTSRRTLGMSQTPSPNSIKVLTAAEAEAKKDDSGKSGFTEGDVVVRSTVQSDKNELGIFLNNFQYMDQNDRGISFYYEEGVTGYEFINNVFTPADNSTVESIGMFTLTFTNATDVDFGDETEDSWFTATCNGEKIATPRCNWSYPFTFNYTTPQTTPGKYEFRFKEGFFQMKNSNGEIVASPEIVYTLTVKDMNIAYSIVPANNSTVETIDSFAITFDGVSSSNSDNATLTSVKAYKDGVEIAAPQLRSDRNPMTFQYKAGEELTEAGTYTFTIEEGTFNLTMTNGVTVPSPAITYTLKIKGQVNPLAWTSEPGNNGVVKEFENLTITYPNATSVSMADNASFEVKKEGEAEAISYNFTASVSGNEIKVAIPRGVSYDMTDGNYTFTFSEGAFLINGTEKSPAMSITFTVNSELVLGAKFMDYYMSGMPEIYAPLDVATSDYGMNEVMMYLSEALTINKGCNSPIVLKYNGAEVASIPATNNYNNSTFAELSPGGAFGSAAKGWLTLKFGDGERFNEGKYSVVIPNGFFMNGDELLNGATLNYSIGMGEYQPASGSTVSLAENINGIVKDGKLTAIKLTTYYSAVELNDYYEVTSVDASSQEATVVGTIEGINAAATLVSNDKKREVIAKFPLNTPAVSMQRGTIVFDLTKEGNSPVDFNGEYTLEFPENYFRVRPNESSVENTPIEAIPSTSFTLVDGKDPNAPDQTYTLVIPAGAYNPYPTVKIKYNNCTSVAVKEGAQAALYYGSTSTTPKYYLNITGEGDEVTFTPVSPITELPNNEYVKLVLKVPAGAYQLTIDGQTVQNYAIDIDAYTVKGVTAPGLVLDFVEDGVVTSATDLTTFTVGFDEETPIAGTNLAKSVWLQKVVNGAATNVAKYNYKLDKTTNTITFTAQASYTETLKNLADGDYRFAVPASLYYIKDSNNKSINNVATNYDFAYSTNVGVDGVENDTLYTVYTLSGIRVLNNADADALKSLAPGFYIINGKKVVLK
ncbi:MAG: hypothetical protein K2N03_04895 [Muribaculaceae bacterium]|nr:hypothetical protein [Muribaculaceae bacterium]